MNRRIALGGVLTLISASSFGLSLGPVQGRAVIGQPLGLIFPVSLSSGETIDSLCASAKVMFGESLVASNQVQINVTAAIGPTATAMVTLRTPVTVNEPYLTVDLQVGCAGRQSRQYLLLTDLKPVLAGKLSTDPTRSTSDVAVSRKPEPLSIAPSTTDSRTTTVLPKLPARLPSSLGSVISATQSEKLHLIRRLPQEKKQVPHLKLEPLDWFNAEMEWSPALQFSRQLKDISVDSTADLSRRAEAAQIWLVMNQSPEQLLEQRHASEANKSDLALLRSQINRFEKEKSDLQAQLSQEQDTKYLNPVVVGLVLALLIAVLGLAISMTRKRDSGRTAAAWWQPNGSEEKSPRRRWFTWRRRPTASTVRASVAKPSALDVNLDTLFKPDSFRSSNHVDAGDSVQSTHPPESSDFLHSSLMDNGRSVAAEELFDLQQQVEFFISLGQSEQAVNLLISHLSDGHEPSPLAYLDLLKLYHQMGDKDRYEELKLRFNSQFNAGVPVFENYSYSRRGLERYEKALSRIQSLWPSRGVLEVIETSLFKNNAQGDEDVFDLEAYRELLLLYGIARYLNSSGGAESEVLLHPEFNTAKINHSSTDLPNTQFPVTNLQALTAQTREDFGHEQVVLNDALNLDCRSGDEKNHQAAVTELDLDLSQVFETSENDDVFLNPGELEEAFFQVTPPNSIGDSLEFDLDHDENRKLFSIKKSGMQS